MIEGSATKWAEIDLGAVAHNVGCIKQLVGPTTAVMAVVKANAYGHGAVQAAAAAVRGGATWLGVSSVEEGLELRRSGIDQPVLNLGYTPSEGLATAAAADLSLTTYDRASLKALRRLRPEKPIRIHVKVNTGMNRLGANPHEAVALARAVRHTSHLRLEGLYTHFADADAQDPEFTRQQLASYLQVRAAVQRDGGTAFLSHAANSAATLRFPEARLDLVRVGLVLYGVPPLAGWPDLPPLRPALRWRALVTNVIAVPPGGSVGYGRTFRASGPTQIATIAAGYADGLFRRLSNRGRVIVRSLLAPIVGTISMDQTTVDITGIPNVAVGDAACLIGSEGQARWEAWDAAEAAETIPYEVLTAISARVPRRYLTG